MGGQALLGELLSGSERRVAYHAPVAASNNVGQLPCLSAACHHSPLLLSYFPPTAGTGRWLHYASRANSG